MQRLGPTLNAHGVRTVFREWVMTILTRPAEYTMWERIRFTLVIEWYTMYTRFFYS